jgi:hypothetical protein
MAIAFRAAGTVVTGANPTVTLPAGLTQGDLMIIVTTGTATPTTPTGWVQRYAQGTLRFVTILTKYATAQEASVAVTLTGAASKSVMLAYSGAGSYDILGTVATGTSTSAATTAQTTTYANDYVLSIFARTTTASTFTTPAGTTSRVNSASTGTINGLLLVDELQAAAGLGTARTSTLSVSGAWSAINLSFVPARTLYWVGGAGTWDGNTTGKWANTSGGTPGTIKPPAPTEIATFDASSGTGNVLIAGTTDATTAACGYLNSASNSLTFSGIGTILMRGDATLLGSAGITLAATNTWSSGAITINSLTAGITSNGVSMTASIIYDATGGTCTLGGALTLGGSTNSFTLTRGTLNLADFTLSCGLFDSNNTNTRAITFGTGNITTTGSGTVFTTGSATNLTFTGTPTVNISNNSSTATTITVAQGNTAAQAFNYNFTTGTYPLTITAASVVNDLNFTGFAGTWAPGTASCTFYGNLTLVSGMTFTTPTGGLWTFAATSGIQVITSAAKTLFTITKSAAGSTFQLADALTLSTTATFTLTLGTLDLGNFTLSTGLFSSAVSNTRSILFGTTGNITTTGAGTVWATTVATGLSYTGTPTVNISNNSATAATVTAHTTGGTAANAFNFNITTGTYALTLTTASVVDDLNFTGFTGTWAPGTATCTFYGSLTIVSGMTFTNGSGLWTFAATSGTQVITSASKTLFSITKSAAGSTLQLAADTTLATTATFTFTNGTLDLADFTLSTGLFSSSNANTRSIIFGTGNITIRGTGTAWTTATATGLTYTGTPTVNINSATTVTVTAHTTGGTETNAFNFNRTTGTAFTLTTSSVVGDLNFTGFTGTWAPGTATCTFAGNLTLVSGMTFTTGSGLWQFAASTGTQVITSGGKTLFSITKTNGGTLQLAAATTLSTTATFTFTIGTLDLTNFTLSTGLFVSSNANTRSILFGTGNITTTGTGTAWTTATATGLTYTGTPTVNISNNSATATTVNAHTTGGTETNAFSFNFTTGTYTLTLTANAFIKSINFSGFNGSWNPSTNNYTFYGDISCFSGMTLTPATGGTWTLGATSGTQTIVSQGKTMGNLYQNSGSDVTVGDDAFAVSYVLGSNNLNLNSNVFTVDSFLTNAINTRQIIFGGVSEIKCIGTGLIWDSDDATNFSYSGGVSKINIANNSATATSVKIHTSAGTEANALNFNFTTGTYTLTVLGNPVIKSLDFTGFSGSPGSFNGTLYGDLTMSSTMSSGNIGFNMNAATATQSITSNGKSLGQGISVGGSGTNTNTVQLIGDLTIPGGGPVLDITSGTLIDNNYNVTVGAFASTGTSTRTLTMGSGTWSLTGTGTVWNVGGTGLTLSAGTSTIVFDEGSTASKTFNGSGYTYNNLIIGAASGIAEYFITGSNTFNDVSSVKLEAYTVTLDAGSITTVSTWTAGGSLGNPFTLQSNSLTTQALMYSTNSITIGYSTIIDNYLSSNNGSATPGGTLINTFGWTAGGAFTDSLIETFGIEDTPSFLTTFNLSQTENSNLNDVRTIAADVQFSITENTNLADTITLIQQYAFNITEDSALNDNIDIGFRYTLSLAENITVADVREVLANFLKSITENTTLADLNTRVYDFLASITENTNSGLVETIRANHRTSLAEDINLHDVIAGGIRFNLSLAENTAVADVRTIAAAFVKSITENSSITDVRTITAGFLKNISENVTLNNLQTVISGYNYDITENINLDDLRDIIIAYNVSLEEASTIEELIQIGTAVTRDITEDVGLNDAQYARLEFIFSKVENIDVADIESIKADFSAAIFENIGVLDILCYNGWFRIDTTQSSAWAAINESQSAGWNSINTVQAPNWDTIDTKQPCS